MSDGINGVKVRDRVKSWIRTAAYHRMTVRGDDALSKSALVFAPHPDDETLGCGGTIIKKLQVGARVALVVMTDGRGSHRTLMDEERIRDIRAREAAAAAERLGIDAACVHQLGFNDRELASNYQTALERVGAILKRERPDEIYVPYLHESPSDHTETRRVALAAARSCLTSVTVCEYPVWFWYHWPWVSYPLHNRRDLPRVIAESALAASRIVRDFNSCIFIGDVLKEKRYALDAYASQMTRLVDDPAWARLQDVAGGEFLQCFFQDYEVFWEREIEGESR